ncbi:hypothetical protein VPH35_116253 [Triticum aestivum]|uniref:Uncharacterized protein n=2 Tax=Aegilops tauschii subsp. strangulata TaxID=200361 RepID=A0A453NG60_AEGTS
MIGRAVRRKNLTVERHASKNYTRAMFEEFGRLLIEGTSYNVTEVEKMEKYITTHNNASRREKWSRVEYSRSVMTGPSLHASVDNSSTLECCAAMFCGSWTYFFWRRSR